MIYLFLAALIFCIDEAFKNRIEKKPGSEFPASLEHGICLEKHHNYGFPLNKSDDKPWLVQLISVLVMIPLTIWAAWLFFTRGGKRAAYSPDLWESWALRSCWAVQPPIFMTG